MRNGVEHGPPRGHITAYICAVGSLLAAGCSSAPGEASACNDGDRCTSSAECCDGLICRLPSEGVLPVAQELKCRTPAQGL
jgi:hypothetical protein